MRTCPRSRCGTSVAGHARDVTLVIIAQAKKRRPLSRTALNLLRDDAAPLESDGRSALGGGGDFAGEIIDRLLDALAETITHKALDDDRGAGLAFEFLDGLPD